MSLLINIVLLMILLVMALMIIRIRHLLAMTMLFGVYSLLAAGLFVVLDAPDVAFTEAAVGTGISTVLMLVTLACTRESHAPAKKPGQVGFALLLALSMGGLLLWGVDDIAPFGAADAPAQIGVAQRFIEQGAMETGVPNLVTAVLASYRGFDTLGEVTVILTAGIGIMLLLMRHDKPRVKGEYHE